MTAAPAPIPSRTTAFRRLAGMELCERFSLHGMKALLTLYLVQSALAAGAPAPWGIAALRQGLESVWGPLTPIGFASQIFGWYVGLSYLALPLGGWIGDRLRARPPAVAAGAVLIAAGHGMLTVPALLLPALALLIAGTGLLKANLAAQVGALYPPGDPARATAFARYLAVLNIGVMLGPLACGWLAQRYGWGHGFGAAGVAMLAGLLVYRRPSPPLEAVRQADAAAPTRPAPVVAALAILVTILGFSAYEQVANLFLLWVDRGVDRTIGGWTIPPAWFAAADGALTIVMVMATTRLPWLARLRHPDRLIGGCLCIATGYALLAAVGAGGVRSIAAPVAVLALLDLGIALLWPAALAIVTAAAPARANGTMVGIFYLHGFFANLAVGSLGILYDRVGIATFWLLHAAIALLGLVIALILRRMDGRLPQLPH